MSPLLTVIIWLLIPAGLLPVLTAWVLRRYRSSRSQALRDRWHLALVLALLGAVSAVLAANRLWGWGIEGESIAFLFGTILLAVDVVSGKWLVAYWTGGFDERTDGGPETDIEREDRKVGDTRRELQAEADPDNEEQG